MSWMMDGAPRAKIPPPRMRTKDMQARSHLLREITLLKSSPNIPAYPPGSLQTFLRASQGMPTNDARAEITSTLVGDGKALIEAMVIGKHVGEYAGIPTTGKDFRVALCVVYHLENDQIKEGRVYFLNDILLQQLGMLPTPQGATA